MLSRTSIISKRSDSLTVKAYVGIEMVLITMNMDEPATANLAGFSIRCKYPDGKFYYLSNRLRFKGQANFKGYSQTDTVGTTDLFPSNEAPFQLFRWLHVPQDILSGIYEYTVTAMYFDEGEQKFTLKEGATVTVEVQFCINHTAKFDVGFTKGYLSSQAYVDKFDNKPIRPKGKKTIDFDTKPFKLQYDWLGGKANKMLFDFLKECAKDNATVSAMIYDCDHPDFIDYLKSFGKNLWAVMDSASLHHNAADTKPEDLVYNTLYESSNGQVVRGFFNRFQHNKILIKSANGKAEKVFTGSANFSIRGLYVQANNSFVIDDENVAEKYQEYFDKVYTDMQPSTDFSKRGVGSEIMKDTVTEQWFDFSETENLPHFSLCFSPHTNPALSLNKIQDALDKAKSSVLFSVMEISGGGNPLSTLRNISENNELFHYGIIQSVSSTSKTEENGTYTLLKQSEAGATVPFSYLKDNVPPPFKQEFSGGSGIVIHDKFIVIDFNGATPVVFTGSSNLSQGGEHDNGDNLLAIYDKDIVTAYAIEAVRLFDHYNFRYAIKEATKATPLALDNTDKWVKKYYDPNERKCKDRELFAKE